MLWATLLERRQLPKLIQEEIHLKNFVFIKEIEFVLKNLPTKKTLGLDNFTCKIYQAFKEEVIPLLHKLF